MPPAGWRGSSGSDSSSRGTVRNWPPVASPAALQPPGVGVEQRAVPDYPIAFDAGEALNVVAKAVEEFGRGAHGAAQGVPLARMVATVELVARLRCEMERSLSDQ